MATAKKTTIPKTKTPMTTQTPEQPEDAQSLPALPEGWDAKDARILLKDYGQGKDYKPGALCLISNDHHPEHNAADDIVVIPTSIIDNLDLAGVTGPYEQAD